jgi:transmembrane sensor
MASPATKQRIEDEASLWAARLEGAGMTDADRAALATWLDADPEHRWVLSRYRQLSAQLDEQFATASDSLEIAAAARRRRRWRLAGTMTALAAAIAIAFMVVSGRPQEIATQRAERHTAALDDGSSVELNAQTTLVVDFNRRERRVRLSRGEALFTVAKDTTRPFLVETPTGTVRVTGTVFNVRAARGTFGKPGAGDRVEVTVLEGNVRVRAANIATEEALTPGRQAVLDAAKAEVRDLPEGAAQDAVAWRQGQVVFHDTPLADALERFAAYHAQAIMADPRIADARLGGRYALDDLNGFLDAVERVLGGGIVRDPATGAIRVAPR